MSSPAIVDEKPTKDDKSSDKLGPKGALHNEKADVEFDAEDGHGKRSQLDQLRHISQKLENPLAGKTPEQLHDDVNNFLEVHGLQDCRELCSRHPFFFFLFFPFLFFFLFFFPVRSQEDVD
jgi:hypothetical protein